MLLILVGATIGLELRLPAGETIFPGLLPSMSEMNTCNIILPKMSPDYTLRICIEIYKSKNTGYVI